VDPLLAEALVGFRSSTFAAGLSNEGTLGGELAGVFGHVTDDLYTGDALLGYATQSYDDTGAWFTDLDVAATFAVAPHNDNNPSGQWCELLHIPFEGGGGATEWIEFAVVFRDDGDIAVGIDFESGSETGGPTWTSDLGLNNADPPAVPYLLGDWHDGVDETTVRLTIVAATGAVELFVDDVSVCTDTIGEVALPEPPDEATVQAGPFQYAVALKSTSLKDGISGAEIIGFDASDTTGWTVVSGSYVGPAVDCVYGGQGETVTFPDNAGLSIATDGAVTVAYLGPMMQGNHVFARHLTSATVPGWMIAPGNFLGGNASDLAAAVSDGGAPTVATIGTPTPFDTQLVVVTIDLDGNMVGWLDGTDGTPADASGVGAVNPGDALTVEGLMSSLHVWGRALTDTEIETDLPAALGL